MKKIILTVMLAVASLGSLAAQSIFHPRVEVGGNFTNIQQKIDDKKVDLDMLFGGRAGLGFEVDLAKGLYLASGVNYRMGGAKGNSLTTSDFFKKIAGDEFKQEERRNHNVTLPLNLGIRAEVGALGFSVEGGAYVAYTFKQTTTSKFNELFNEIKAQMSDKKFTDKLEAGLGLSAAIHYDMMYLRLGTDFGLTNVSSLKKLNTDELKKFGDKVGTKIEDIFTEKNTEFYLCFGLRF